MRTPVALSPMANLSIGICLMVMSALLSSASQAGPTAAAEDFPRPAAKDGYVGSKSCKGCHGAEYENWKASHHYLAMQPASEQTVLGDFNNASITHYGVSSRFFRQDADFMVTTEGPDGKSQTYRIEYAFGAYPLQQYLIAFAGGRLQALSLAWDSRPAEEGGQRWFHLYPEEKIAADDELHWTGLRQNWNTMCADCHSTNLHKNYDADSRTFNTTWSEVNVACEACHGPGQGHLDWASQKASAKAGEQASDDSLGLVLQLDEREGVHWRFDEGSANASRSQPLTTRKEVGMCAQCHSRRSPISDHFVAGESFLDHYMPVLLTEGLYHPDGQINDEVFVHGSFIQSKMFDAGVTCSDCHEPHTMELLAPGNGVCLQCHQADTYNQPAHHFHPVSSSGAQCATCHMPPKNFMVIDARHDHSMRIPRPDLSVSTGSPNACTQCHQDKSNEWAAAQVLAWYGDAPSGFQTYAETFHAARRDQAGQGQALAELVRNTATPDIARATALSEISSYLSARNIDVLTMGLSDDDPTVRVAAVGLLELTPSDLMVPMAFPMLQDPVRAVRIEAARLLAPLPWGDLPAEQRQLMEKATQEYIEAQMASAERPEAQSSLGNLYLSRGDTVNAELAYRTALELDADFVPGYVNLADFYRSQGQDERAGTILQDALKRLPDSAALHHANGLLEIRQKRTADAMTSLQRATRLDPDSAQYVYVYGVAMHSAGNPEEAISVLQQAHLQHPNNRDILSALVAFNRDQGNEESARQYAEKLRTAR